MRSLPTRLSALALVAALAASPALAASIKAAATQPTKPAKAVKQYTIEQFLGTTSILGASFSPDNSKLLVSTDQSGIFNAYAIPTTGGPVRDDRTPGGEPIALTRSTTNSIFTQSYFPRDERIVYQSDQGGNELDHLYVRDADGTVTDITPGDKLKANFVKWAGDGNSFLITTNERDARFFDVYEVATDGYRKTLVYQDTTGLQLADVSNDKRYAVFALTHTTVDNDIILYDRQTKSLKSLTPHKGEVNNQPQAFSADSKSLYYVTDEGSEFLYLVRMDLASGKKDVIEKPKWDVTSASVSKGGKYLAVTINADAQTEIHLYDAATMKRVALPAIPNGEITEVQFSADDSRMCFFVSSSRMPRDLFVMDLPAGKPRQLTRSLNPEIDAGDLVEAEVVRFKSYDGVEVPGILYKPAGATSSAKAPALLFVHGGPGDQSRVGYSGLIQYLVNHGYVMYAINNRGSSGYGKTFYTMDDKKHGEADLDDCVASKKMLIATGVVDPARIGIAGGSYGGYMVLAALTYRPKEFAIGVDLFGVANWVRTLENIPPYWESFRKALYKEMGDPSVDGDYLRRISPLFHADKITQPLIVLQGKNDPRVLKVESDEIVAAVKKNGVDVEYVVFDDEGHGFVKKENRIRGYRAILEFSDKHLKGNTAG